jgi:dephospho-CoA kinase
MTISQRLIGLTGGIGTGKTTVTNYLATVYNLPILDADLYARKAVALNSPILKAIFNRYGDQVRLNDGSLNRKALGDIIFNNSLEKTWLENQIHPFVRQQFKLEIKADSPIIVLAIPLLFEAKMTDLVTEIWVVSCSESVQLERVMQRDHLSEEEAKMRVKNQFPLAEKIKKADVILDNSGSLEQLFAQVDRLLKTTPEQQKSSGNLNIY